MLPALLQVLDCVNVQHGLSTQRLRFFNHGFAPGDALGARGFKRRVGSVHRRLPKRLNFCKNFFAQVACVLPLFNKAVEAANVHFPVSVGMIGFCPGQHFINQHLALRFDRLGLLFNGF